MVILLVAANLMVMCFLSTLSPGAQSLMYSRLGAIPQEIVGGVDLGVRDVVAPPFTALTSLFVHTDVKHLAGNMIFILFFGWSVEKISGSFRFLLLFFVTGALGVAANCVVAPGSDSPLVGASGAAYGIMGAYFVLCSGTGWRGTLIRILVLVLVVGNNVITQEAGVSWSAHIGGFVSGALITSFWGGNEVKAARREVAYA